jgi:hypothetical protein
LVLPPFMRARLMLPDRVQGWCSPRREHDVCHTDAGSDYKMVEMYEERHALRGSAPEINAVHVYNAAETRRGRLQARPCF